MRNRPIEFAKIPNPRDKEYEIQPPFKTIAPRVPSVPRVEYHTQTPAKKGATWRQKKQVFWPKAAVIALSLMILLAAVFLYSGTKNSTTTTTSTGKRHRDAHPAAAVFSLDRPGHGFGLRVVGRKLHRRQ